MSAAAPQDAPAKVAAWQAASAELARLEVRLGSELMQCAATRADPPRQLVIDVERQRERAHQLYELALEALDAQSSTRTGLTNFGGLE